MPHLYLQVYLDNILINSKVLKKHDFHISQVLQRLKKVKLQANIDKYEFHIQETKFFNLIVSTKGI